MKSLIKMQLLILLLVHTGCSATRLDDGIPHSVDPNYGYSPHWPIALSSSFEEEASRKTADFLGSLRTANGENLEVVGKFKVANPNYRKPKIILYNWIAGEHINQGNGRFLIQYQLRPLNGRKPCNCISITL